jgi:uncharacterized damage-inducible protein DinB
MAIRDTFTGELKFESALTKKMLERVPLDLKDWRPHEKSTPLGRLATHIAETHRWISTILKTDEFDFAATPFKPHVAASQEELQAILHTHVEAALFSLSTATDDDFNRTWTIRRGELVVATLVKKAAVRSWGFSHTYHHRGQLSVYLRLLNIPVPGMYGPSADER